MPNLNLVEKALVRQFAFFVPFLWSCFSYAMFLKSFEAQRVDSAFIWSIMVFGIAFCFAFLGVVIYRQLKRYKQERLERIACALLDTEEAYPKYAFRPINVGQGYSGYAGQSAFSGVSGYTHVQPTGSTLAVLESLHEQKSS